MSICGYSFNQYVERAASSHAHPAPGVIIGGFMVDLAYRHLPEQPLIHALCETSKGVPGAIQILTPCNIVAGSLTIVDLGRFAFTLYDKSSREGVRVSVDPVALEEWPEIRDWFFKFTPKEEQDLGALMAQIEEAEASYCAACYVRVAETLHQRKPRSGFAVCACCGESFPLADGLLCLGCQSAPLWQVSRRLHVLHGSPFAFTRPT